MAVTDRRLRERAPRLAGRTIARHGLLALALAWPSAARAAPSTAVKRQAREVAGLIADGDFDAAGEIIEREEGDAPDPFLFLHGVLEERRGDCRAAIVRYQAYVDLGVPEADAAAARAGIERCEAALPPRPDPPPAPHVEPEPEPAPLVGPEPEPEPEPAALVDSPPPRRVLADPWGAGLTLGGAATVVVGGIVWGQARGAAQAANDAAQLSVHERNAARADRFVVVGGSLVAVGSALIIAGALRYAVVAKRRKQGLAAR